MEFKHFQGPHFSLQIPTDWLITSSPQFQALFLGPATEKGVQPNLSVAMRRVEPEVTPPVIAEETRKTQEKEYPKYKIIKEADYTERGGLGFLRKYKWFSEKQNAGIVQIQAFFVLARMLFTITATRLEDDQTEELDKAFETMISSFRIN